MLYISVNLKLELKATERGLFSGGCVSSNLKETMPQTPRKTAKISVVNSTRWLLLFFWGRRGKGGKVHCSLVKNRWLFIAVICCHCHCCHFVAILPLSLSLCLPSVLGISLKSSCYFCRPGEDHLEKLQFNDSRNSSLGSGGSEKESARWRHENAMKFCLKITFNMA